MDLKQTLKTRLKARNTYTIGEIVLIRDAARAFDVETFALDLLCAGLTVEESRERLEQIAQSVDGKKPS